MRRLTVALLLGLCLAGCTPRTVARDVYVRLPAPPPSVVLVTDTLVTPSAPDTVFVPREVLVPGATRVVVERDTVTRTVPAVVVRYATPRPDTSRAVRLYGLTLTADSGPGTARLRLAGTDRDWTFLAPRAGETLLVEGRGPRELVAAVRGAPSRPPAIAATAECPATPTAILDRSVSGWTRLVIWLVLAMCFGAVAALLVRR